MSNGTKAMEVRVLVEKRQRLSKIRGKWLGKARESIDVYGRYHLWKVLRCA